MLDSISSQHAPLGKFDNLGGIHSSKDPSRSFAIALHQTKLVQARDVLLALWVMRNVRLEAILTICESMTWAED